MQRSLLFLTLVLSVFSTAVMSYIAMATPIGPWIAPTLVLCAMLFFAMIRERRRVSEKLVLVSSAGSVGGIIATALGFSFPTLYFLDPSLFNAWMASPLYFCSVVGALSLIAGLYGMWLANIIEHDFIVKEQLSFPIGQLIYKMISAQNQMARARELMVGFFSTTVFCALQDGLLYGARIVPKAITLIHQIRLAFIHIPTIQLDMWPMLWAIGFVTGHVIALPLAVGAVSRVCILDPMHQFWFAQTSSSEFALAFCSGMVLSGALMSFLQMPSACYAVLKEWMRAYKKGSFRSIRMRGSNPYLSSRECWVECAVLSLAFVSFFTYFKFSALSQLYLFVFSGVCAYQIAYIAGKIGLAQLGRFATFVMVPALFLFGMNYTQLVLVATFVELVGGVCADILFGRKVAHLAGVSPASIRIYQYVGLMIGAASVGLLFWLLIKQFTLGSPELFAQRAQARQLLINVGAFNYLILIAGFIFGYLLKYIKMNPMLVLGGLLMPLNISLGLIIGGFAADFTHDKERWYPFWSGIFAANSVWMLVRALC